MHAPAVVSYHWWLVLPPVCWAQVAANTKGIQLVLELIAEHSLKVVQAYMSFIQANAGEEPTHACLHCHCTIAPLPSTCGDRVTWWNPQLPGASAKDDPACVLNAALRITCGGASNLSMLLLAAEAAVREMLCEFAAARALPEVGTVKAEDQLDDGSTIALSITIDRWGRASATRPCAYACCCGLPILERPVLAVYTSVYWALRAHISVHVGCNMLLVTVTYAVQAGWLGYV